MTAAHTETQPDAFASPVLLCFDGSEDASAAISRAAQVLGPRPAVVLTVWEPVEMWEPYDPVTFLSGPVSRLASHALGMDEIVQELAQEKAARGAELACEAGFAAEARVAQGKSWHAICDVAEEIGVEMIVVGARGLSRMQSALLGSVSAAVIAHAHQPVLVIPSGGRETGAPAG